MNAPNAHWSLVLSGEIHATTKVVHNTNTALSERVLEEDPGPKHHIFTEGLYYMEQTALDSNTKRDVEEDVWKRHE